ncbi:MAG: hypothetical protein SF187_06570 [Deltaproteobacteria bacterium]|nr:hypothetical protein [Deltaproteobacteria bacterium]
MTSTTVCKTPFNLGMVTLIVISAFMGCGESNKPNDKPGDACTLGSERCSCLPAGDCMPGLVCASMICVQQPNNGGLSGTGGTQGSPANSTGGMPSSSGGSGGGSPAAAGGASVTPTATSACGQPRLIDDMEVGDGGICVAEGRKGGWYVAKDETPSATITPMPGLGFPFTVIPGGRANSKRAVRFSGTGLKDWGAVVGFGLNHDGVVRSTYNASGFNGVKFFYKSSSAVRINFLTADQVPVVQGGKCATACYKWWGVDLPSTFDWIEQTVLFSKAVQQGISGGVFHTNELFNIEFQVPGTGQAFELWVDDISFAF